MIDADFPHVRDALVGMATVFKDSMEEKRLAMYWSVLKDMQRHEFDYCTQQILKTYEFNRMPPPAAWFKALSAAWK